MRERKNSPKNHIQDKARIRYRIRKKERKN